MSGDVLSEIEFPERWTSRPLWAAACRSKDAGQPEAQPLSVFLDAGVVPRDSRGDNHNQLGEDLSRYLVVSPGDIVFNKLRTWQGGLGVSKHQGIVSPAYFVCRPTEDYEPHFLHYLLRSAPYLRELTRISKWMPPSQFDTPWEVLRRLPVIAPPLEEQRRIADFLDAETSRIDRMISLQKQVQDKLENRFIAQRDLEISRLSNLGKLVPLRRFVWAVDQGSSPQCDAVPAGDGEWGVLKVSCLRPGVFLPGENKRLPDDVRPNRASEVKHGDLLITRANTPQLVGATAVVGEVRPMLLLSDKIFRVRLTDKVRADFVAEVAAGTNIRALCAATSNGASQSMANIRFEEVKAWPIPLVPLPDQVSFVTTMRASRTDLADLKNAIQRQLDLLSERRQALITAAVTGQFDVSTASGRNTTQGV